MQYNHNKNNQPELMIIFSKKCDEKKTKQTRIFENQNKKGLCKTRPPFIELTESVRKYKNVFLS